MARPSNRELVKRAERTRAAIAEADPKSTAAFVAAKRKLLDRINRDAEFWYEAAVALVLFPSSREDDPKVKIITMIFRSLLAEQRNFPAPDTGGGAGGQATHFHFHAPPGQEIRRGTLAARGEALEAQAVRRRDLDALPLPVAADAADPTRL